MNKENSLSRACIYFIYDKDGIIDDYVYFQLKSLKEHVDFLHCVINGKLSAAGRIGLSQIADEVYVRDNIGRDIGAYKAAIQYIGWEKLENYDELILMNNTCFGPVYPLNEVFSWADSQSVEIWGFTWGLKTNWFSSKKYLHFNDRETHIQSYFLAIRKPLLGNRLLRAFFDEIPNDVSYAMSGSVYEYAFPGYFEERGYRCAVYCDDREDYNYPLLHNPVHLLEDYRMPFFKKRSFFHHYTDVLNNTCGEATARLIRFLESETSYDMNLVWDSILRTCNLADVVRCAQLNRILPRDMFVDRNAQELKVGVVYHAYYEDLFEESLNYLANFPQGTGVLITTNSLKKQSLIQEMMQERNMEGSVIVVENRGRDVSSLLVGGAEFVFQYDLICFAHDKKTSQVNPQSVGRSWQYKLNENTFASKEYVQNVIDLFSRENRLGIAFPAYPNHSGYSYNIGTGWTGNYSNTHKLLNDFDVHVKIDERALCVAPLGTFFWFRPQALKKLFRGYDGNGWSYKDFPREPNRTDQTILHAVERAYAYFAQDAGFYPAYLYNDVFTRIELTNLEFNKVGSAQMHVWMDEAVHTALYSSDNPAESESEAPAVVQTDPLAFYLNNDYNFGIKESLRHLAIAMRYKWPNLWKFLLPVRRIGQKLLKIKTR